MSRLLHPDLTPWWSFLLADGAHHKKPHSPTHPGVEEITKCLDELFKDKSQSAFAAYDAFTSYRRSRDTSIQDYIVEFNLKYKINIHHMKLPDAVLAYYLLKCANLSEEHSNICKATCSDLTYKNMRSQIEKVTADLSSTTGCQSDYHVQPQYCIFEGNEGLQDFEYEEYYEPYPVQSAADSGHQLRPETSSHPHRVVSTAVARTVTWYIGCQ